VGAKLRSNDKDGTSWSPGGLPKGDFWGIGKEKIYSDNKYGLRGKGEREKRGRIWIRGGNEDGGNNLAN